jgi:hypothetical protein
MVAALATVTALGMGAASGCTERGHTAVPRRSESPAPAESFQQEFSDDGGTFDNPQVDPGPSDAPLPACSIPVGQEGICVSEAAN